MLRTRPKIFLSTQQVEKGRVLLDLDKGFIKYNLPGHTKQELEHILNMEYNRLDRYLRRRQPLYAARIENEKKQSATVETTFNRIMRYQALEKVEQASAYIASGLYSGEFDRCIIFGLSHSVMTGVKIFLHKFRPTLLHPGSRPINIERAEKAFISGKRPIIILNIKAGFGLNLQSSSRAFFIEQHMDIGTNVRAVDQLFGTEQQESVYIKNFCLKEPLDMKLMELLRSAMKWRLRGEPDELPRELM